MARELDKVVRDGGRAGVKTQVFGSQSAVKEDKEPILQGRLEWKEQLSGC